MYEVMLTVMDAVVFSFWGWCLYRFCGSFLVLRRLKSREETVRPVPAESRRSFFKNGWPMWCFWTGWKWLVSIFTETDYNTVHLLLRTVVVYGALFLFLWVFYEGRRGTLLFSFVTFVAVSESSRFLAHAAMSLSNHLYDLIDPLVLEGRITDLEAYLRLIKIYACLMQVITNLIFMIILRGVLRRLSAGFAGGGQGFERAELKFLLLPGCTAIMFCVLLRIILVTVEDQIPQSLYEKYPLLTAVVPLLLILCLCLVLYSTRLFCRLRDLHEEKNRSLILEKQLEGMEEHLRETERIYAKVRAMKHDMRNQLAVVTEMAGRFGAGEELQAYLAQLNQTLSQLDFPCRTGSAALDTLVAIKYHEMREKIPGISFQTENLLIPKDITIRPLDLSLILGNGLDNAIEACERLAGAEGKMAGAGLENGGAGRETASFAAAEGPWIRVSTMMRASFFLLEIANSFDGNLNYSPGREFPETSKKDTGLHGIGLTSIRETARKYCGGVDWQGENKVFTLTVMLKAKRFSQVDKNAMTGDNLDGFDDQKQRSDRLSADLSCKDQRNGRKDNGLF